MPRKKKTDLVITPAITPAPALDSHDRPIPPKTQTVVRQTVEQVKEAREDVRNARHSITVRSKALALDDKHYITELVLRFRVGWSVERILEWIQIEHGDNEVDVDMLRMYKRVRLPDSIRLSEGLVQQLWDNSVGFRINALERLYMLAQVQHDRIDMEYQIEQSIGKLFSTTVREIAEQRALLRTIVELEMGLGLRPTAPQLHLHKHLVEDEMPEGVVLEDDFVEQLLRLKNGSAEQLLLGKPEDESQEP